MMVMIVAFYETAAAVSDWPSSATHELQGWRRTPAAERHEARAVEDVNTSLIVASSSHNGRLSDH